MHRTLGIKVHTVGNDVCASESPLPPPSLWRNSTSYTAHIVNLDDDTACANGSFNFNSGNKKTKETQKETSSHSLYYALSSSVVALVSDSLVIHVMLFVGRLLRELNIVTLCFALFFFCLLTLVFAVLR